MQNQICPFHLLSKELRIDFGIAFNHLSGVNYDGTGEADSSDIIGDLIFHLSQHNGSYMLEVTHSAKYSDATVGRMAK